MQTCSDSVHCTGITANSSKDKYRSTSGRQPYIVPYAHAHISKNRLQMTIDCRGPWEASYELRIAPPIVDLHFCRCTSEFTDYNYFSVQLIFEFG